VIAEKDSALAESYSRIEELEKQLAALQNQNK
jgi:polyhydroxyalkanoate synthesis regulator phasin